MADPNKPVGADPNGVATPAASDGSPAAPAGNLATDAAAAAAAAVKKAEADPPAADPPAADPPAADPPAADPPATDPPAGDPPAAFTKDDFKIDLGKTADGVDINTLDDGGALDRFKDFCVDNKYTPEQAQSLISYQQEELAHARQQLIDKGTEALKGQWGLNYTGNKEKSLVALTVLDRKMEGRLAPAFAQAGLSDDPIVIEALYEIGMMIGEDNLGASDPGGVDPNKEVSREEAYNDLWNTGKT